jgi:RsmE family RNA methyltransferase
LNYELNPAKLSSESQATSIARVPHPSQPHREEPALSLPKGWDVDFQIAIAIGPEGGWTPEEMSLFTQHQWQPVTLGPRILSAETAAIASTHLT